MFGRRQPNTPCHATLVFLKVSFCQLKNSAMSYRHLFARKPVLVVSFSFVQPEMISTVFLLQWSQSSWSSLYPDGLHCLGWFLLNCLTLLIILLVYLNLWAGYRGEELGQIGSHSSCWTSVDLLNLTAVPSTCSNFAELRVTSPFTLWHLIVMIH